MEDLDLHFMSVFFILTKVLRTNGNTGNSLSSCLTDYLCTAIVFL